MTVIYFLILSQKIGGVKTLQNLDTTEYLILIPLEGFQNLDCGLITSPLLLQSHGVPNYSDSSVTDFKSRHSTDGFKDWESFLSHKLHRFLLWITTVPTEMHISTASFMLISNNLISSAWLSWY